MHTGDYDDMQMPNFGMGLLPAAGSSTTNSFNRPQNTQSQYRLEAPLMPGAVNVPVENSTKPTPESEQQQKMVKALEKNTQMYICADKLRIHNLRKYAAKKFKESLWAITDAKDTYPAVRLAFENTHQEDKVLCNEVLRYCVRHHQRIHVFPTFLALLQKCEPSAWRIGVGVQREKDNQQERFGEQVKILKKEILRAERNQMRAEVELDSTVQLVNGTRFMLGERCTNADMKLELHTNHVGTKQYQLTCKCCNKRHLGEYLTAARDL